MNCFYHPQTVAVALCKSCSRGCCLECVASVDEWVACKGRCENQVRVMSLIFQREKGALPYLIGAAIAILSGFGTIVDGLIFEESIDFEFIGMGIFFMALGIYLYRTAIRTRNL